MKTNKLILFFVILSLKSITFPIYIVTGANSLYFPHLLNLIGSLHKVDFDNLEAIAVFDFGLTQAQRDKLSQIEKVALYEVEKTHPDILTSFSLPTGGKVLGWFAWKAVVIKQALDYFPYVLWLDAGTTVLRSIDGLAKYIAQQGYFLCTSGDEFNEERFLHDVGWGATAFVRAKFCLETEERKWILKQETIMGGILGVARDSWYLFGQDWYDLTYDMRNFADDGTTPSGFGTGRHDQTVLSSLAYPLGLVIHKQDYTQQAPFFLETKDSSIPFYITWNSKYVNGNTIIYSSRGDLKNYNEYYSSIKFKK